jgi:hypothetical protein
VGVNLHDFNRTNPTDNCVCGCAFTYNQLSSLGNFINSGRMLMAGRTQKKKEKLAVLPFLFID